MMSDTMASVAPVTACPERAHPATSKSKLSAPLQARHMGMSSGTDRPLCAPDAREVGPDMSPNSATEYSEPSLHDSEEGGND